MHKSSRGGWNAGDERDDEVGGWQKQVWRDRQSQRSQPGQQREDETLGVGGAVRLVNEGKDGRGQFRVGVHSGQVLHNGGQDGLGTAIEAWQRVGHSEQVVGDGHGMNKSTRTTVDLIRAMRGGGSCIACSQAGRIKSVDEEGGGA